MTRTVYDILGELRETNSESALHSLLEAPNSVVPDIVEAFRSEKDANIRERLVFVIWHHKLPGTLDFLEEAFRDTADSVWKQALDGIVAIGGNEAVNLLRQIQSATVTERLSWTDEAIEQLLSH